jgi:hypothetical protein
LSTERLLDVTCRDNKEERTLALFVVGLVAIAWYRFLLVMQKKALIAVTRAHKMTATGQR